jgi:hypothetical protein
MKYLKKNNKTFLFLICPVLLYIILGMAVFLYPVDRAVDTDADGKKRLQIEIYGGISSLTPGDLNLLPAADALTQEFLYEGLNNYLYTYGYIISWGKTSEGEYKKFAKGFPLGLRIKYYLSSSLAFSVGFRTMSRTQNSNPSFGYRRTDIYRDEYMDRKDYSLYTLSARGYAPLLGIHLEKPISKGLAVEGYAAGGVLFARCRYAAQWRSELLYLNTNPFTLLYEENGSLEQEGNGTGFVLEGGVRVNVSLGNRLGIFLGAGYAYQSAGNISGKGKEVTGDNTREWDERWAIKREHLVSFWVNKSWNFPPVIGRMRQEAQEPGTLLLTFPVSNCNWVFFTGFKNILEVGNIQPFHRYTTFRFGARQSSRWWNTVV